MPPAAALALLRCEAVARTKARARNGGWSRPRRSGSGGSDSEAVVAARRMVDAARHCKSVHQASRDRAPEQLGSPRKRASDVHVGSLPASPDPSLLRAVARILQGAGKSAAATSRRTATGRGQSGAPATPTKRELSARSHTSGGSPAPCFMACRCRRCRHAAARRRLTPFFVALHCIYTWRCYFLNFYQCSFQRPEGSMVGERRAGAGAAASWPRAAACTPLTRWRCRPQCARFCCKAKARGLRTGAG